MPHRNREVYRFGANAAVCAPVDGVLDGLEGGLDVRVADPHGVLQRHLHLGAPDPGRLSLSLSRRGLLVVVVVVVRRSLLRRPLRRRLRRALRVGRLGLRLLLLLLLGLVEAERAEGAEVGVDVGGEAGHGLLRQLLRVGLHLRLRLRLLLHQEELALELLVLRGRGRGGGGGGRRGGVPSVVHGVGGEAGRDGRTLRGE